MVLRHLYRAAKASASALTKALGGHPEDKHLTFIYASHLPELRTICAAPSELRSDSVFAEYTHHDKRLHVRFEDGCEYTFIFREDDIMVLSTEEFSFTQFRTRLKQAVLATREAKKSQAPNHYPMHG